MARGYRQGALGSPGMLSPEQQQRLIDAQGLKQYNAPQSQMVSGHYIAPSWTQYLAEGLRSYMGGKAQRDVMAESKRNQSELAAALRKPEPIPESIRAPGYQAPNLTERLAQTSPENYPAQQMAMQLRMQEAMKQEQPRFRTLNQAEAQSRGLGGGVWQESPTGELSQAYAPQTPDYNKMIITGPDGKPMVNQQLLDAKQRLAQAGRSSTSVDVSTGSNAPQVGTIPQGYELAQTDTGWQMRAIPGGPAAIEADELERKQQATQDTERETANLVSEDIGRAKNIIQQSPTLTTGFIGNILQDWAGTPAADLNALLDTVGANISFDYLNTMRQNSPTGGALGNVTERELDLLRATAGNLRQSQSADQLMQNLQRLEQQFNSVIHGGEQRQDNARVNQFEGFTIERVE